jgi:hypothetical protein
MGSALSLLKLVCRSCNTNPATVHALVTYIPKRAQDKGNCEEDSSLENTLPENARNILSDLRLLHFHTNTKIICVSRPCPALTSVMFRLCMWSQANRLPSNVCPCVYWLLSLLVSHMGAKISEKLALSVFGVEWWQILNNSKDRNSKFLRNTGNCWTTRHYTSRYDNLHRQHRLFSLCLFLSLLLLRSLSFAASRNMGKCPKLYLCNYYTAFLSHANSVPQIGFLLIHSRNCTTRGTLWYCQ